MHLDLDIFEIQNDWLNEDIYLAGIKNEIRELVDYLGGSTKAARNSNLSYSVIKEAKDGRASFHLKKLNVLLELVPESFKQKIICKILGKHPRFTVMRANRNRQNLLFPRKLNADLAYIIGLILGDGHLAGDLRNYYGDWTITVCFDNPKHMDKYRKIFASNFGTSPKYYFSKKNYYDCYLSSKVLQWFFRSFFKIPAGKKGHIITIPERILNCGDTRVVNACIKGLFDSDGTVTKKYAGFSSTSNDIVEQAFYLLQQQGVSANKNMWIKAEKYLPLYTIQIRKKESLERFRKLIGFSHPIKRKRLNMLLSQF